MASLPSLLVSNTMKLQSDLRKQPISSLPAEKPNYSATQLGRPLVPINLEYPEASSLIRERTRADSSIYVPLLQECVERNSISDSQIIHGHIIKTGTDGDVYLMTFLINVYAKCGAMESARKVLDNLPTRNVVSWTSLMSGYVHNSQPEVAIRAFLEMFEVGVYPSNYTLGVALSACYSIDDIELGKQIHAYTIKYNIQYETGVGNALCKLYSSCSSFSSAVKAFRETEDKNVISWTAIISSCGDHGDSETGLSLFSEMLSEAVEPNEFTLMSVLRLCSMVQNLDFISQLHSLIIKLGYLRNQSIRCSIMHLYSKRGRISDAKKLIDGKEPLTLVTWNATIASYAQMMDLAEDAISANDIGLEALNSFQRLHRSGTKPDPFTFSSILTVCGQLAAMQHGEQVHAQTIKTGFQSDVVSGTALVNMYTKCGSIKRASRAFVELPMRTLITWTIMITGFATHGRSQQALQLFDDMRTVRVRPNKITFVGVLSACRYAGMVDEALVYFEMMKNEYKIKPGVAHFACLVDMFVRLGRLDEAFGFIKKMAIEPNEFIWSTLVAGCLSHGNVDLGCYAAEQLLKLNPRNPESYDLLLDMYLTAGRLEDVSRVRKLVEEQKIRRSEDWSWITINGTVYSFKADDKAHPEYKDIDRLLTDLIEKARKLGYEPRRLRRTDEEAETSVSNGHQSEKLAVAFGLLKTANAAAIRVLKSISVCRNSHDFVKFASVLTSREIVVKDSTQFHRFVSGRCSCGDFGYQRCKLREANG